VIPVICTGATITEAGTVPQARAAAVASVAETVPDQIVFIQYYDEEILARTDVGGGIQSEDSVEITLRASPASLYTRGLGPGESRVPGTWCNIATVTDGPANRGSRLTSPVTRPVSQSFDADTLCHRVVEALLDIRKTALDAVVSAGASVVWEVEIANAGSANLLNVAVHDTVDAGLFAPGRKLQPGDIAVNTADFPGATLTINPDSFTFRVDVPVVPAGLEFIDDDPGSFDGEDDLFRVTIPAGVTAGTFCNRVTARSTSPALVETDISCVVILPGAIEFDVSNEDGFRDAAGVFQSAKEVFFVGDGGAARPNELVYQVIITNRSTVFTATNVRVVDAVGPVSGRVECRAIIAGFPTTGTTSPAAPACNASGFTWNIGSLGPGVSAEIQFRAEALLPGNDLNRVTLTADQISGSRIDEEPTTVVP